MTLRKRLVDASALGLALMIGSGLSTPPAHAAYIVTLTQAGSDVVATGSGTIDTAGLSFLVPGGFPSAIAPSAGEILTGPTSTNLISLYTGVTGPASFGSGVGIDASSGSGDAVGVADGRFIELPEGYVSGSVLTDSSTYDNQTFSSLGVTPGTYVYTFGSGATADSFTLQIGAAPVPEPASALLLGLPLGLVMLLAARHRHATHQPNLQDS